ncbi:MAG: hypothetical protein IJZ02_06205 [Clostridia bacterium]|nr:hypothetical protein [Clostridia bacterium]
MRFPVGKCKFGTLTETHFFQTRKKLSTTLSTPCGKLPAFPQRRTFPQKIRRKSAKKSRKSSLSVEKAVGTVENSAQAPVVENPWKPRITPIPPKKRVFEQNADFAGFCPFALPFRTEVFS